MRYDAVCDMGIDVEVAEMDDAEAVKGRRQAGNGQREVFDLREEGFVEAP